MKRYCLILFVTLQTQAVDITVEGEVHFSLRNPQLYKKRSYESDKSVQLTNSTETYQANIEDVVMKTAEYDKSKVRSPMAECKYQLPEEAQVHALLSNMMNELTKMFVRAHDMMKEEYRRAGETRFKMISQKNTNFFENIYTNMTKQLLTTYNTTAVRVVSSGTKNDSCENQSEMKEIWKNLIDNSLITFRRAAFECIEEHLKAQGMATDSKARARLGQYLIRELKKIKKSQLDLLCDRFQLCYIKMLRRANKQQV